MKKSEAYQKDIESIRDLMERSVKFISLSGLSGIMAGIYALLGAAAAFVILPVPLTPESYGAVADPQLIVQLLVIALVVLVASIATGFWLSGRKARKAGIRFWDDTGRRLVLNLAIPLVSGGIFILVLLLGDHYAIVAPSFLLFYGLALINASPNLYDEVRYLGYSEILLGLICALLPGYGLVFWAVGFGVFHIFYGAIMYKKYDT